MFYLFGTVDFDLSDFAFRNNLWRAKACFERSSFLSTLFQFHNDLFSCGCTAAGPRLRGPPPSPWRWARPRRGASAPTISPDSCAAAAWTAATATTTPWSWWSGGWASPPASPASASSTTTTCRRSTPSSRWSRTFANNNKCYWDTYLIIVNDEVIQNW